MMENFPPIKQTSIIVLLLAVHCTTCKIFNNLKLSYNLCAVFIYLLIYLFKANL